MAIHSYESALDYLYSKLPMFQRVGPPAFKKSLNKTRALMAHLGNPQDQFESIHLAGTNGKGSVAHMLASIFQASGRRVGLHTSPHYLDFRERIKLNGQLPPASFVQDFVARHQTFIEELGPSFFEVTVGMAFAYFAEQEVDIAVVETGLGGRLDSTNVLTPLLCVITNISYDHQQFLGDTLPEIAWEKAGIIKKEVPVIIGETHPETESVFLDKAMEMGSPIIFADQVYHAERKEESIQGQSFRVWQQNELTFDGLWLEAWGAYQQFNLVTTLAAFDQLKESFELEEHHLREGLSQLRERTHFRGRWQLLGEHPLIIADSAHNQAGVEQAMHQLRTYQLNRLHLVWGSVQDKDQLPILRLLPSQAQYYFVKPNVPRGLEAEALKALAAEQGLIGASYESVQAGLEAAKAVAAEDDLIYVGGSIFVVAEVI